MHERGCVTKLDTKNIDFNHINNNINKLVNIINPVNFNEIRSNLLDVTNEKWFVNLTNTPIPRGF